MSREVKFGVFVPQGWKLEFVDLKDPIEQYETMVRCAQEAERAGYDSLWLFDHFHTVPTPELESTFECWTSMAGLARDTTTIRLGQMVTCNSYRPPSLLAKMSSCIDVMSHGRLIVGIGAGWYEHEYNAYGYQFGEMPDRLRMLRESVQILHRMWTGPRASFEGRFYQVRGAINEPKPVQKPHPPLWIGGGGEKVTLKLVAQYGDACNIGTTPEVVRHKLDVLRQHCETVGRNYDEIIKSSHSPVILGDETEVRRVWEQTARQTGADEATMRNNFPCHGPAEQVTEHLSGLLDAGVDYLLVSMPNAFEGEIIQRVAEEVLPLLRRR
ncbi:LLM class F420-dependent oxidoreductase [Candidatus Dormiibacter inghamiae]|uniref:LLM class F420-dependent oxidoreductase n=1 Tax=Candidatus Dormiibacter inghamiae TaxID=3127013 RepID=UPI0030C6C7E3